jgi:hypothetical protein
MYALLKLLPRYYTQHNISGEDAKLAQKQFFPQSMLSLGRSIPTGYLQAVWIVHSAAQMSTQPWIRPLTLLASVLMALSKRVVMAVELFASSGTSVYLSIKKCPNVLGGLAAGRLCVCAHGRYNASATGAVGSVDR